MTPKSERVETFEVIDGHLVRKVVPVRGEPYEHRCPRHAFENVAQVADEFGTSGFTLDDLAEWAAVTHTQAAVALAFMKERGCVETRYRRNYPASSCLFEDAMTEYHDLAEKG